MLQDIVYKEIMSHLKQSELELGKDTQLSDLGIDSLGAITILYELEDKLGIEVPNEVLDSLKTIGDILNRLEQIVAQKQSS